MSTGAVAARFLKWCDESSSSVGRIHRQIVRIAPARSTYTHPSPPYHRYDETLETIDASDREHDNEPEKRVADVTGKEASELRHFLRLGDAFAACYT